MPLSEKIRRRMLGFQKNEITEYHIYRRLAARIEAPENRKILLEIAEDELRHYHQWKEQTGRDVAPDRWKVRKYGWINRVFGFTFGLKRMENGEKNAQNNYREVAEFFPESEAIAQDEEAHEEHLLAMLDEERLRYIGSIVLGLNDALVELTGALAGLTLALRDTRLIALTGSITGLAAALSMSASEYLSTKAEKTDRRPLKASIYTGIAYIFTVLLLILPYLLFANYFVCLAGSLLIAVLIIALFNYFLAVARNENFKKRFCEMAGLSLCVTAISFLMGFLIREFIGVDL